MHWEIAERGVHQPIEATMAALPEQYGLFQGFRKTALFPKTSSKDANEAVET